ncbi:MAG: hypothetical protein ACM3PT_00720 [Deltaproteobacteria bacterium]
MKPNKSLVIILSILILDCSFFYSQLSGAELGKSKGGYIASISYGHARQFSDIPSAGGGWGTNVSLGKNLYYDQDAMFGFDLVGNLFFNKTKGLETDEVTKPFINEILKKSDYNTYFMNHKTSMFGLGVDGKLTYNKSREDQNWYGALQIGGNWGIYSVKMDMEDAGGKSYKDQFDLIKNLKDSEKEKKLDEVMDGKYESKAEDFGALGLKSTLMPSVGLEFGYDITDYLTVFVANKLFLRASNRIDGEVHIDDNRDKLNYLNLGLNVYFGKKRATLPRMKDYESVPSKPVESGYRIPREVESHNFPEVKIVQPDQRSFTSDIRLIQVKARITNISSALDVYCKQNENKLDFEFSTNYVTFNVNLKNGENKIQVYGKNENGESRDIITIFYYGTDVDKPIIKLTEPPSVRYKAVEDVFTIKAQIDNIKSKEDLKILANGTPMKSYNFNASTREFKIKVRLAEGLNNFEIIATNEAGSVSSAFDIYFNADIPDDSTGGLPDIEIISPGSGGSSKIEKEIIDFKAKVKGVKDRNAIRLSINGLDNTKFNFNPETGEITDRISLKPGETTITVTAINVFGEASNEVTVIFDKKIENAKKNIIFTEVSNPDFDCNINITVKIIGATGKKDIGLYLNNNEIKNFSFSNSTSTMKSSLFLDEGDNIIKVVLNRDGASETEIYTVKCLPAGDDTGDVQTDNSDTGTTAAAPLAEIVFPLNHSKVETKNVTLQARIENINSKNDVRLSLNGEPVYDFSYSESLKELRAEISLAEGENKIFLSATNTYGVFEKELIIIYEEPLAGPASVLINSPRNGFNTEDKTTVFRATIQNVKKPEDISVRLNDQDFTDYNFDEEKGIIFGYLPARLGQNNLIVSASNRLGSDSDDVVFYSRKEHVPAVKIISPKNNVIMGVAFVPIEAIVQNIKKSTSVVIYSNGVAHRSLKLTGDKLESNVPLKKGSNQIIVKAVNDFGSAADTLYVQFGGKPEIPEITFLNPATTGTTVRNKELKFEAKVTGIRHSSNVELYFNEVLVDEVYFFKNESKIAADLKLIKGLNIIRLSATNDTGVDEKSIKIYFD